MIGLARRPAARGRGAGPVEPPAAGAAAARTVHRRRRGDRPGRAARPAGARRPPAPRPRPGSDLTQRPAAAQRATSPPASCATPGWSRTSSPSSTRPGCRRTRLQLELLETAVIQPEDAALTTLRAVAETGLRIAIDDFGTGHANHAYLRRLPLHELKLAAEFVTGGRRPGRRPTRPAPRRQPHRPRPHPRPDRHRRGRRDRGPGRLAARAGCDTAQGWHFSRALPGVEVRPLLAR